MYNHDSDVQASLMRSARRKTQLIAHWGLYSGILGRSLSELGTESLEEAGIQILEESEFEQGIPGNEPG